MIKVLVNGEIREIDDIAPNLSVLDWLRTNAGLAGTKEGCASGDCGACTVAVGDTSGGVIQYQSVNACLMLMGNLHGKHLITVDALASAKTPTLETLHPVQRAMVECHGSQCGFCTPGFIMSMFALYESEPAYPGRDKVIEALGGNLCRCTGYRPIIEACERMYHYPREAHSLRVAAEAFFNRHTQLPTGTLNYNGQSFFLPQTQAELLSLTAQYPQAKLIAGGTDLSLEFTQTLKEYDVIISVAQVAEMKSYQVKDGKIRIGAALPYTQFLAPLCEHYPELHEMFERLGSRQIRNAGTLGGSLGNASPIGDPAPAFIALGSQVEVASKSETRLVALDEFFAGYRQTVLQPGELITAIVLPERKPNLQLHCYKISKRMEDDISAVLFALAFELTDGVIESVKSGFGGMAATPKSAQQFEQALTGKAFTQENLQQAGEALGLDFKPMSDVRATSDYRLEVCKNLLERVWLTQQGQTIVRVAHATL